MMALSIKTYFVAISPVKPPVVNLTAKDFGGSRIATKGQSVLQAYLILDLAKTDEGSD